MVMKTGEEIITQYHRGDWDRIIKADSRRLNHAKKEKWYLASDIDKRIAFYDKYRSDEKLFKKDCPKAYEQYLNTGDEDCVDVRGLEDYYNDWLFNLCLTNLDKDFEEIIGRD